MTPAPNPNKDAIAEAHRITNAVIMDTSVAITQEGTRDSKRRQMINRTGEKAEVAILALIDSEATKRVKEFTGEVQNNLVTSHLKWGDMNLAQQIVSDTLTRFIGGKSQ